MQTIRLGLTLDTGAGAIRRTSVGDVALGPLVLLNLLETHLGLLGATVAPADRVVQMRQCLHQALTPERFYARSFEADELGTAATLLAWRDRWYEHGWDGRDPGSSPRLADMAAVEAWAGGAVAPGVGQRLAAVMAVLDVRRPQIERIDLLDPLDDFPPAWRRVLARLPVATPLAVVPQARPGTLLRDLQHTLLAAAAGERVAPLAWRDDGSLHVVRAQTLLAAAQWQAARIAGLPKGEGAHPSLAVVATGDAALLDAALAATGQPRLGTGGASALRPALQLLPLVTRLLWAPLDFGALLQFLTHPLHPLHPLARRRIAAHLADTPGVGGERWQKLVEGLVTELGEHGAAVRDDVAFWIDHPRFDPLQGAPLTAVIERVERLAAFFANRLHDDDAARRAAWLAGHAQAVAVREALRGLAAQGQQAIGREMLERLVAQAGGRGSGNPLLEAQVGAAPAVADPAAVVEPFDEVVWWPLAAPPLPAPYPWSPKELAALRAAGVALPAPEALLQRRQRGVVRAVAMARDRLTLVLPPPDGEAHPLWAQVEQLVKGVPVHPVESALGAPPAPGLAPVPHRPLPARRRWWQLLPGTVVPAPAGASYTSLEPLLFNPSRWVLQYAARLRPSTLLDLPDDFRLLGTLGHRTVERLYRQPGSLAWSDAEVEAWFDGEVERLVDEEGAVLRMPGRGADLEGFRQGFRRSLVRLHRHLRAARVARVEPEKALNAETPVGRLEGSADLLLHFDDADEALVDMKWSGEKRYLELLGKAQHLQLAVYARMRQAEAGRWPQVAYYVLRKGALLAPAGTRLPDARTVALEPGATAGLWQRAEATWRWRQEQIGRALIEVVVEGTEPDEASQPPDGTLEPRKPDDRYNPYVHLAGWGAGQ
jgi:hypothetical protein